MSCCDLTDYWLLTTDYYLSPIRVGYERVECAVGDGDAQGAAGQGLVHAGQDRAGVVVLHARVAARQHRTRVECRQLALQRDDALAVQDAVVAQGLFGGALQGGETG